MAPCANANLKWPEGLPALSHFKLYQICGPQTKRIEKIPSAKIGKPSFPCFPSFPRSPFNMCSGWSSGPPKRLLSSFSRSWSIGDFSLIDGGRSQHIPGNAEMPERILLRKPELGNFVKRCRVTESQSILFLDK